MFYRVPLESYTDRYTEQMERPVTGWLDRKLNELEIRCDRIEGDVEYQTLGKVNHGGVVLDPIRRSRFSMRQIDSLLRIAKHGKLTNEDTIFFSDFWTPGFEALPYTFHQLGIKPKMYAFCWAQSVDIHDFTHNMKSWIRHFEKGIGKVLDGVFVASNMLADLLFEYDVVPAEKCHVVGLPFDSTEVASQMSPNRHNFNRGDIVIFSSRFDKEKNPLFFMEVISQVLEKRPETKFIICSGRKPLPSNYPPALEQLRTLTAKYPTKVIIADGLSKTQYYSLLCSAKIQFNCSLQDWVSFTLLEASVAGCYPIYPRYRSFPETFLEREEYLYDPHSVNDAAKAIIDILNAEGLWTLEMIESRSWIHKRFDWSWIRMLGIMKLLPAGVKLLPEPYDSWWLDTHGE